MIIKMNEKAVIGKVELVVREFTDRKTGARRSVKVLTAKVCDEDFDFAVLRVYEPSDALCKLFVKGKPVPDGYTIYNVNVEDNITTVGLRYVSV